jgi:hypothetical protein
MPQTLTFFETFQRADWASMSIPFIYRNGGVLGFIILLIGALSLLVFITRQMRSTPKGGGLFIILGIVAMAIGVVGTMLRLAMANEVIHSTKGAADPAQVDQAYTVAATTTVLGLAVLVVNLIFLFVAALRAGSSAEKTS